MDMKTEGARILPFEPSVREYVRHLFLRFPALISDSVTLPPVPRLSRHHSQYYKKRRNRPLTEVLL